MEIWIKHQNLIDFPYKPGQAGTNGLFTFDEQKVANLVSEIMFASPTCYLVSGYRGAGKTSFIRRVQEGCQAEASRRQDGQKGVLFVYSSFSRFESKTNFLRKLIRDLHEAATGWESKKGDTGTRGLNDLYLQTTQDINKERSQGTETEKSVAFSLDIKDFFGKILKAFAPILAPLIFDLILTPAFKLAGQAYFPFIKVLIFLLFIGWGLWRAIKVTATYSIKDTSSDKVTLTALSDDEITEYDLDRVLDTFYEQHHKVVFVLDELDKIEDGELDQLLRQMKPWLVKGKADFILVAGQRLTMRKALRATCMMRMYQSKEIEEKFIQGSPA